MNEQCLLVLSPQIVTLDENDSKDEIEPDEPEVYVEDGVEPLDEC